MLRSSSCSLSKICERTSNKITRWPLHITTPRSSTTNSHTTCLDATWSGDGMLKGRDGVGATIARLVRFFNSWLPDFERIRFRPASGVGWSDGCTGCSDTRRRRSWRRQEPGTPSDQRRDSVSPVTPQGVDGDRVGQGAVAACHRRVPDCHLRSVAATLAVLAVLLTRRHQMRVAPRLE